MSKHLIEKVIIVQEITNLSNEKPFPTLKAACDNMKWNYSYVQGKYDFPFIFKGHLVKKLEFEEDEISKK